MNETVQVLLNRKSVRAYEPVDIPETDVEQILQSAVQAATAGNMTLWSCIRVTDPQLKADLADHCDHQPFIAKAPLVLVFYADYRRWVDAYRTVDLGEPVRPLAHGDFMLAMMDAIIAAQSAVSAADALGYGCCYIGDVIENWEWHREAFKLPPLVIPACMVVIGVPTEQQKQRVKPPRFHMEDVIFENVYQNGGAEKMRTMLAERQGYQTVEELDHWLTAFARRKHNGDFSHEMSRSAKAILDDWLNER